MLTTECCECGRLHGCESQAQFSLGAPDDFRAALPFGNKLAVEILKSDILTGRIRVTAATGPDWQYHVTLNRFDRSVHLFLSVL